MKLIVLDYFFTIGKGHDFDYDHSIIQEALRRNIRAEIWSVKNKLRVAVDKNKSIIFQLLDAVQRGMEIGRLLHGPILDRETLILVQKIDFSFMLSFFIAAAFRSVRPRVIVVLRRGLNDHHAYYDFLSAKLIDFLNHPFMRFLSARKGFVFYSDSELVVDELRKSGYMDSRLLPIPHLRSSSGAADNYVIGYFGGFRIEKGSDLLPGIIKAMLERDSRVKFIIHCYLHQEKSHELIKAKDEIIAIKKLHPDRVELIDKYVSAEEYDNYIRRCSIVLIPYRKKLYGKGTSGIVAEAIVSGAWVVVPEGTWMDLQHVKYDRVSSFSDFSIDGIVGAIEMCLNKKADPEKIKNQINAYRKFHSVENYLDILTAEQK